MGFIANLVLRYKLIVVLVWVAIAAGGVFSSIALADRMTDGLPLPGREGYETNVAIAAQFGTGGPQTTPLVPVVQLPDGSSVDDPATAKALTAAFGALTPQALAAGAAEGGAPQAEPAARVASFFSTDDRGFVSADGRTTFGIVYPPASGAAGAPGAGPDYAPAITSLMTPELPSGATLKVTGLNALQREQEAGGGEQGSDDNRAMNEALFAAAGALVVLLFVFASLLALVPLIVAAVSILATYLAVLGLTYLTDIDSNVEAIVVLIGLGVAIDYSLLLVTRWREEISNGRAGDDAVRRALLTAGRSVMVSGGTVALGLASLVLLPVPILRSVGYTGLLIPVASVAVTITLLPVLLATIGRRVDWPRIRRRSGVSRVWTGWARGVIRMRWAAFLAGVAILGTLCFFALGLRMGEPSASAYDTGGPAGSGLTELTGAGLPSGPLTPIDILVPAGSSATAVAERLASVPGLQAVAAPDGDGWASGGARMITALPVHEASSGEGRDTIEAVRETLDGAARVGGVGAQDLDFLEAIYGNMPLMLVVLLLVTFVILARSFRSLLLALKAIVLNIVSIGAAYGVVVLIWQDGYGSRLLFDAPATGSIDLFTPLIVFAFLYGLSMDYEVFILARIREEYDGTGSTRTAIINGLGRTGMLVTSAALILFFAFAGLGRIPITLVQVLATGLGVGILLDATVVRALLVPATVALFGRWNWWMPAWAAKVLFVAPSPAVRENDGVRRVAGAGEPADRAAEEAPGPVEPADDGIVTTGRQPAP